MLDRVNTVLERAPAAWLTAAGGAGVLIVGCLRWVSGPDYAFSALFLIPVAGVSWFVSRGAGLVLAVLSTAVWLGLDLLVLGHYGWWAVPAFNELLRLGVFILVAIVVAELRCAMRRVRDMAMRDPLTGVANRRAFVEKADEILALSRRQGFPLAVVFLDADGFKKINDSRGHREGDRLLQLAAAAVVSAVRESDVVGRLGGDEFVVLLPDTDRDGAESIAGRLIHDLDAAMDEGGFGIRFSVGVAAFPDPGERLDDLLRHADALMYEAKASGGGMVAATVSNPEKRTPGGSSSPGVLDLGI